jgi:hypothetical protein
MIEPSKWGLVIWLASSPTVPNDVSLGPVESYKGKHECLSAGVLTVGRMEEDLTPKQESGPRRFGFQCVPVYSRSFEALAN